MRRCAAGLPPLATGLLLGVAYGSGGCGGHSACDDAIEQLAALRPETVRDAPLDMVTPWKELLGGARTSCTAEGRASALERVAEVEHAITMRSADLAIAAATAASASASSSAPAPPPVWTLHCADVVTEGAFSGLLPAGIPRSVAARLVAPPASASGAADAGPPEGPAEGEAPTNAAPAGAKVTGLKAPTKAAPDEALTLGGSPVYLTARGNQLEGATFDGTSFEVKQSLAWPPELAGESGPVDRVVAARGPDVLGVAWVSNLTVFFAVLDPATEKWTASGELPVSGDDGGRDLVVADVAWGRASFGLTLRTASGFAIVEVLPNARAVRPATLVKAFVAGTPRIAWGGERFVIAAGRADGEPSLGFWLAPDGVQPASWLPLLPSVPAGSTIEPLLGDLVAKDGAVHLAFRVGGPAGAPPQLHLGHALGSTVALETCR